MQSVVIPQVGESVSEGTIALWLVENGQSVAEGDTLLELETDKATLEVPSPASGIITIDVEAGTDVAIGQQVASIAPRAGDSKRAQDTPADTQPHAPAESSTARQAKSPLSPSVRRIVAEHNIDVSTVKGSGRDGRITKEDVLAVVAQQETRKPQEKTAPPQRTTAQESTQRTDKVSSEPAQRSVPLSRIRKRIAANLVQSKLQAAHLTTFNEIDMSEVIQLRSMYRDEFEKRHGIRLGFMSFFVRATCLALQQFPAVNAFLEGDTILYNRNCHVGVALASDNGLVVPVLRQAEEKSFAEIEHAIKEFSLAAREKRLSPDAFQGGTFTITNGGVFGSLLSTPIPNPPQTAILGMHAIKQRPAIVDGAVVARPLMYVALTYDHRLIDGKEAVGFLKSIQQSIEEPARLMLNLS